MNSTVVSSAEQALHFCSNLNQISKKPLPDNIPAISFSSQVTKSRISIKSSSGPCGARCPARISAYYSPAGETLYQVLGVAEEETSASDIKKAYKKMARLYHPDVSPPGRVDEYTRRFIMVHQAYETLSNPHTRALYDRDLAGGFGFASSTQERVEKGVWKARWESQLDELKRRGGNRDFRGKMSWGARMRNQTRP
ncbi:chaperone protein Dnaj 20 chloroplastic [Phtheirospermum japonicum]|uniref:Chaperone protein Dnaj 20 chloroplastic n=1 Tax=Phtheirospermum japonicum TaxID=374723 RepID=A0A830C8Z3_9LAMI|nr:chaperone protein Dnaj 20 chloroplastic [Phtheirospermum japonicum]